MKSYGLADVLILAVMAILYFALSFVELSFSPVKWCLISRVVFVLLFLVCGVWILRQVD